jgi:superfamily I DNA and/or RNA helicase
MGFVHCALPHPLYLVLPERCLLKAAEDYPGLPFPQTVAEVEADFLESSESGVLTLVDEKQPDRLIVSFCTPRYELVCGLTPQQDAFFALRLAPLSLRTHNQITRGAVRVVPQIWGLFADLPDLNRQVYAGADADQANQPGQTSIEAILACWKQARQPAPSEQVLSPGTSSAELAFLANVDTLIDLACQVELEQAARQERISVKAVEPAAIVRASGVAYRFWLATQAGFRVGEYLQAGAGETGIGVDGVVVETTGSSLVLRFYQAVELKTLQRVEWLAPKISTKQYTIQHAAVNALRNGESLNPRLLQLIVENHFEAYEAPSLANGTGKPNPAQKTLIERALLVPDLLLALGPPGTGKTETIREIVARQAALGKKVLVTSKNNKAVDNVLDGLKNVQALRIGREEVVAPEVRPLLIDNLANAMQQKIMEGIQPVQENLDGIQDRWPLIQHAIDLLAQLAVDWRLAQTGLEQELTNLQNWQQAAYTRVERLLERQKKHFQLVSARLNEAAGQAEGLRQRLEGIQKFSQSPLIGPFFTLLADKIAQDWQATSRQYRDALLDVRKSRENLRRSWEAYRQFVTGSAQALQFKQAVVRAEATLAEVRTGLSQALGDLTRLSGSLPRLGEVSLGMPAMPLTFASPAEIETLLAAWRRWSELNLHRKGLLQEWRDLLQTHHQALYPALIRRADVVGATCIGIATDLRFEDLEFDLVIADEAGQIQVMDLLVPLVRARRAVLVGDHLQLPPVVEPEITLKIRENEPENQELGEWLEKSLFERLIERSTTPANNRVMLDTQYRLPRQIADFISAQFYGGNYHTGSENEQMEALFTGSPLVFVDTMKEVRHFEQRAEDGQGYFNPTEARLISDLLLAYQAKDVEVGVIVPYKKQAEIIRRELRRRQAGLSEDDLVSRVATVDSFQGKELDVIIFGFTRSNAEGRIGFLTELRRLNVSLTRARHQLVLVGDSLTLTSTPDQDFARLTQALLKIVKQTPKGYVYANELPRYFQS